MRKEQNKGFTLLELSIVLFIVALLVGGLLVPLGTQVDQRKISDTQKAMDEIKEALIGFAVANGRLPCPDVTGDGLEDVRQAGDAATEGCHATNYTGTYQGFVPWATLGVAKVDAWGDRFRYEVANEFTRKTGDATATIPPCTTSSTDPNSCTLELVDTGNITVNTRDMNTKAIVPLASNVPAVILSFGKNGYGATSDSGIVQPMPPAVNVDETTNATVGSTSFVSRPRTDVGAGCSDTSAGSVFCEFDDLVTWVPTNALFNRMVAAGTLP